MLFNCIISNPPYNKGLDLKILQDIWELGETIVFVHPSMWLYDKKGNHKLFLDTKKLVKDHVTHAEEIENSNHVFNIQLFQNIFITKFEQNPNPDIVIDLKDIDLHHTSQVFRSLCLKILMYCKKNGSLEDKLVHTNPTELWECGISGIRGHYQNPDLYTFVRKQNPETHIGTSTRYYMKFLFESEIEATNFRDFLKLKLVRFCLSLYKIQKSIEIIIKILILKIFYKMKIV
jgi:hypothetical protein